MAFALAPLDNSIITSTNFSFPSCLESSNRVASRAVACSMVAPDCPSQMLVDVGERRLESRPQEGLTERPELNFPKHSHDTSRYD